MSLLTFAEKCSIQADSCIAVFPRVVPGLAEKAHLKIVSWPSVARGDWIRVSFCVYCVLLFSLWV